MLALLTLAGCASGPTTPKAVETPAQSVVIPDDVARQYNDAQTLLSVEDYAGAAIILESLTVAYPQYPAIGTSLAICHRMLEDDGKAQATLESTLVAHPDYPPALNEVGILHRKSGEFAEAEAAYLKAVTVNPDYALAHLNLGILLDLYLGRHQQALEHYERYQQLVPDEDKQVARWISDISRRLQRAAQVAR